MEDANGMMRSFVSIVAMVGGAIVFAGDPSRFNHLDYATIPGSMIVGGVLFICGIFLWLRNIY